ncbi:MAG: aldehyde dehydrogenase family protein [Pseudomonadota bacterium]|nr:aldehyde dehydrogenase family protein [Pseudomonadota bacterium]
MKRINMPYYRLFINGKWVDASDKKTFPTMNPATGEMIATVAEASAVDVGYAVNAARQALDSGPWGKMSASQRGRILMNLADLLQSNAKEMSLLESMDAGKPISAVIRQDVAASVDTLQYYAGWADKIHGEVIPARKDALTYTLREPVGVVAAIVPWNFPLMIALWKIAPALAAGCTVVLKPAALTPLSALRMAEFAMEAGVPAGVINIVPGSGRITGNALVEHPGVNLISFTGSVEVGRGIMHAAADGFKRVALELGGKSANLVFADADLDAAVKASSSGVFFNSGQVCSAGSRILVENSIYDEFVERLVDRARTMRVGDPLNPDTHMGPVISELQRDRVLEYIEIGQKEGATLVSGGQKVGEKGYFLSPAVFADVGHGMRISQEEIFGPVASVLRFKDENDAVEMANGTRYGLAAAVWSQDVGRAHALSARLKAGTVWVNTYGPTDIRLPWGGSGDSGVGRERGHEALEHYTEPKVVWVNLARKAA